MDVLSAIQERRSVRAFKEEDVSREVLQEILEAGIQAPSAGNRQPWQFLVVRRPELRRRLAETAGDPFIAQPPVLIVACVDSERSASVYGDRGRHLYCLQDVAAAIQNILLAATAHGLATCWVGAFPEERVARVLNLPARLRPVAMVPLGFPGHNPRVPPRRPLNEVCTFVE